jgi:hypothetical protein
VNPDRIINRYLEDEVRAPVKTGPLFLSEDPGRARTVSRKSPHLKRRIRTMKNARMLITMVVLLAAVSVCVQAQDRSFVRATIPFPFTVENTNLPAGSYTFYVMSPFNTLRLQNTDGGKSSMIRSIASLGSSYSSRSKLVFRHTGNAYFLTQVWEEGSDTHRDLFMGSRAREMAKNRANQEVASVEIYTH